MSTSSAALRILLNPHGILNVYVVPLYQKMQEILLHFSTERSYKTMHCYRKTSYKQDLSCVVPLWWILRGTSCQIKCWKTSYTIAERRSTCRSTSRAVGRIPTQPDGIYHAYLLLLKSIGSLPTLFSREELHILIDPIGLCRNSPTALKVLLHVGLHSASLGSLPTLMLRGVMQYSSQRS